jgi:hypothetical protein
MPIMEIETIIKHLRERDYMSGVDREKNRVKATGEVFTPKGLVQEVLDKLPQELFNGLDETFIDPTCGDGQFLSEVIIRKIERQQEQNPQMTVEELYKQALSTTYGADLMMDNCLECIRRLYMVEDGDIETLTKEADTIPTEWKHEGLLAVFKVKGFKVNGKDNICNIVCADGLKYDYSFGKPDEFGNGLFTMDTNK